MNKNIRFFKAQKLHYGGFDAQWLSSEKMRRSRHRERADSHWLSKDEAGILLLPDHYATKGSGSSDLECH